MAGEGAAINGCELELSRDVFTHMSVVWTGITSRVGSVRTVSGSVYTWILHLV